MLINSCGASAGCVGAAGMRGYKVAACLLCIRGRVSGCHYRCEEQSVNTTGLLCRAPLPGHSQRIESRSTGETERCELWAAGPGE